MICIVDYGMGNLRSVSKALEVLGAKVCVTSSPKQIERSDKVVLPGVGEFGHAMAALRKNRLVEPIVSSIQKERPFLGICLGLQLLLEASEESPSSKGFGIIKGKVKRLSSKGNLKIPQMGWNQVTLKRKSPLTKGLRDNSFFYFVHSFYAKPLKQDDVLGVTKYGSSFASILEREPVFAVQFHPEKSQQNGLQILKNFISY